MTMKHMARESPMLTPDAPPAEPYYPHCVCLTMEDLHVLGLDELPSAGTEFHIEAVGVVSHASSSDHDADGDVDSAHCILTLTHIDTTFGDSPPLEDTDHDAGSRLYGSG